MLSAGQLGMSAQDVADVVAYLKEGDPAAKAASPTTSTSPSSAKAVKDKKKIFG